MRAFIIRPFGKKKDLKGNEINFDLVAGELIGPALAAIGAEGRETLDIVQSGNIRVDMFRRLLTADIVVADLSIHNANVFYEIGIRHALRQHGTFMLRCNADAFPFDLQTDRYFTYDQENPKASLPDLIIALKRVLDESHKNYSVRDSPVFASLPMLTEPDPALFNPIPQDFGEDVDRATVQNCAGDLRLLANEVRGLEWELNGLRTVGKEQFGLRSYPAARVTWELVRAVDPDDLQANLLLGTIFERLGDLKRSNQALNRALDNESIESGERAEVFSLLARNAKTQWREEWRLSPADKKGVIALQSKYLRDSFNYYKRAFDEDLNHFYSGLNALALLSIMNGLAGAYPESWKQLFDTDEMAASALTTQLAEATKLAATVETSVDATLSRLRRDNKKDVWVDISAADLRFIISKRPARVATAYSDALQDAPEFARDAVAKQLAIFKELNVVTANLAEVEKVIGEVDDVVAEKSQKRKRVLIFAGHMIDAADRESPRFPPNKENIAREKIKAVVEEELKDAGGIECAFAGGANGGDILFQEICEELGIKTQLYLAMSPTDYVSQSVSKAGDDWKDRFWKIYDRHNANHQVRVLSEAIEPVTKDDYLPAWLRSKPGYGIWQRNNLWMLFNALEEACDPKSEDPNLTLIALWDGGGADGPGGTEDLVKKVDSLGARREIIKTNELFGL
jgi:hypothetical protein